MPVGSEVRRVESRYFAGPALEVAARLLGCTVCHRTNEALHSGRIVEVEAYTDDAAAHAAGGKRTPRNAIMFGPPGFAYIYLSYGVHHCLNVVTESDGVPGAVLIRGLDRVTIDAPDVLPQRRSARLSPNTAAGPGLACRALELSLRDNGRDLGGDADLWISAGALEADESVVTSQRIGISKAMTLPWRLYVSGSAGVSKRDRLAEQALRQRP